MLLWFVYDDFQFEDPVVVVFPKKKSKGYFLSEVQCTNSNKKLHAIRIRLKWLQFESTMILHNTLWNYYINSNKNRAYFSNVWIKHLLFFWEKQQWLGGSLGPTSGIYSLFMTLHQHPGGGSSMVLQLVDFFKSLRCAL